MADLTSRYMGLSLKNPLVPSSSPLSKHLDSARRLEDAGAAALVLHSLFEELIEEDLIRSGLRGQGGQVSGYRDGYLEHLSSLKSSLDIPVIASLNGTSAGGWVDYARDLEQAGADGLEINVYYIPASHRESAEDVEARYIDILESVRGQIEIPIAMKLSPQFSSLVNLCKRLEEGGADALVLFNRFYQPDIDLDTLEVVPKLELSNSEESLLRGGPGHLAVVLRGLTEWLEERGFASVDQLRGSVSQCNATDSAAFLRANYLRVLDSYNES
jgi:dihydroorotate dehydrogenase (fumarate)